jgi:ATP-binding cassette subfamily F protein 3
MLTISGLNKAFGGRDLLRDAQLFVGARDRIALVGLNGTGKTTLLEMIAGHQSQDSGDISLARDVVVGYLPQETDSLRGKVLLEEVLSAGSEVTQAAHRLHVLQDEIEATTGVERDCLVAEYGRLHDRFSTLGGYSMEFEARRILAGLGFKEEDLNRRTETFSGGWLMRIALSKLLLAGPDLLMLDEPTNHLDVESVEWLERFLHAYEGAILLISHDRDFINGLATRVVEIDGATLTSYTGNYESFVEQRRLAAEQLLAQAKNQARRRAQLEVFVERFRYKNTKAKQVQSKIKMLDRMDPVAAPRRARKTMGLSFPTPPHAGRVPLELKEVEFGYDDVPVYESLDLVLERTYKVALVGPNGAGKSTLLKLLAGALEPRDGQRIVGNKASIGYFAQHQIEALVPTNTVVQELQRAIPPGADVKPRDLLGRFLFSGDDVDKRVSVLSGGEKTRLALAKLLVTPANVLCLDEPTNHLDIPSRDALEDALIDYEGALVLITHDRHLIRSVVNRIVEVKAGAVQEFDGDYDYYLGKRRPDDVEEEQRPAAEKPKISRKEERRIEAEHRARTKRLRDRVRTIEEELDELRAANARIEVVLGDPDAYSSGVDIAETVHEYEVNKRRAELLEEEWAEASTDLERADQESAGSSSTIR